MKIIIFILLCSSIFSQTKVIFTSPASVAGNIDYDNQWIDHFYGGRNIYNADLDSVTPALTYSGFMGIGRICYPGIKVDSTFIDSTYHDAFVFKYNDGEAFPKYINPYSLENRADIIYWLGRHQVAVYDTLEYELNSTLGFWINRTELNGNGIMCAYSGNIHQVSGANLGVKGYKSSFYGGPPYMWEVFKVVGDYSYLKFYLGDLEAIPNGSPTFLLEIYNTSANDVTQFTIYNPTIIYSKSLNPFKRYTSQAEKDSSLFIGKRIVYVGDSQFNDGYFHASLADSTGANIVDEHYGGYRMAYSSTSWFYQDTIKNKVFAVPDVDLYFLPISSNDNGGGDTLDSSIDSVRYYYPYYGDHADTVTAKLLRFATLSEARKAEIFEFQQTYCAYIQQLKLATPTARIVVGSIPIGSGSGTMTGSVDSLGYGIWNPPYSPAERTLNYLPLLEIKKVETIEVSEKCNTEYINLMGTFTAGVNNGDGVRMDFYNFNQFCLDGAHWDLQSGEIKKRIASLLKDCLK